MFLKNNSLNWLFKGAILAKFNQDTFEWYGVKRLDFVDKKRCQDMINSSQTLGERLSSITSS